MQTCTQLRPGRAPCLSAYRPSRQHSSWRPANSASQTCSSTSFAVAQTCSHNLACHHIVSLSWSPSAFWRKRWSWYPVLQAEKGEPVTNEWGGAGLVAVPAKRPGAVSGVKIKVKLKKEKSDKEKKVKKESKKDRKVRLVCGLGLALRLIQSHFCRLAAAALHDPLRWQYLGRPVGCMRRGVLTLQAVLMCCSQRKQPEDSAGGSV